MHGKQSMKRTLSAGNLYREEDANSAIDDPIAGTSSTTAGTSTSTGYTVVNSKRRCKRKQPSNQALSQQPPVINDRLHMYDEVINSVANQSESNTDKNFVHPSAGDSQLPFCDVSDRINDIQRLKETVIVLQNQLNFVLSFLGITEVNNLADDHYNVLSLRANNTIVNKQPDPMTDRVHPQLPESVGTDAIIVEADHNQTRPSESYAKVFVNLQHSVLLSEMQLCQQCTTSLKRKTDEREILLFPVYHHHHQTRHLSKTYVVTNSVRLLKLSNVVVLVSHNRAVYNQFMPLCDLRVMQKR